MKHIVEAKAVWQRGGIALVCEKCTKERFVRDFPEHTGDSRLSNLKGYLKDRLKAEGRWGPIRVVTSSCLDVCSRGGLTVLLNPFGAEDRTAKCLVVDPLEGREALYDAIVTELTPPSPQERRRGKTGTAIRPQGSSISERFFSIFRFTR
jgi:hypothetical protein